MTLRKTHAPVDGLFEQTYKLTYFCEELAEYAEKQSKKGKTNVRYPKHCKHAIKEISFILRCCILFVLIVSVKR